MESTESDSLAGRTIHGNLLLKSRIGAGGMGTVYLAENAALPERKYAVKVLHRELTDKPGFRERFYDEARQQAQLDHPNIVQMFDFFQEGDDYFLVLAFVDGHTLGDMIDLARGPLPQKQALQLIEEVLAALNCAHEHGILHRDVKASNVLVDQSGRARLTDFGIARPLGGPGPDETGMTIGTIEYMSPEQIREPDRADQRSDVYSAGILLFEMLTGRLPFAGPAPEDIRQAQLATDAPDPRQFNPAIRKRLAAIVGKALRKDPDMRYQGCLEFQKTVHAYAHPLPRMWPLWALAVVAAGGAAYYFLKTVPDTREAVEGHLAAAVANYTFVCQENEVLANRRESLRLSRELDDPKVVEGFVRQLKDIGANVDDFASHYGRDISAMKTYDQGIVQRVLDEVAPVADDPDSARRARYRELAVRDYRSLAAGKPLPGREALVADCPR